MTIVQRSHPELPYASALCKMLDAYIVTRGGERYIGVKGRTLLHTHSPIKHDLSALEEWCRGLFEYGLKSGATEFLDEPEYMSQDELDEAHAEFQKRLKDWGEQTVEIDSSWLEPPLPEVHIKTTPNGAIEITVSDPDSARAAYIASNRLEFHRAPPAKRAQLNGELRQWMKPV